MRAGARITGGATGPTTGPHPQPSATGNADPEAATTPRPDVTTKLAEGTPSA